MYGWEKETCQTLYPISNVILKWLRHENRKFTFPKPKFETPRPNRESMAQQICTGRPRDPNDLRIQGGTSSTVDWYKTAGLRTITNWNTDYIVDRLSLYTDHERLNTNTERPTTLKDFPSSVETNILLPIIIIIPPVPVEMRSIKGHLASSAVTQIRTLQNRLHTTCSPADMETRRTNFKRK